jgi:hypothetical protein
MKKRLYLFLVLILILIMSIFLVLSQDEIELTDEDRVEKAYTCLEDTIDERKCEDLKTQEKIFAVLATGKCKSELLDDSKDEKCWPKSNCDIKNTAQAILALDRVNVDTTAAVDWLKTKTMVPTDLIWYLEIETKGEAFCTIGYDNREYSINIAEDKMIDTSAGICLSLSENSYWLTVSPTCYDKEFEISCTGEGSFLTTLLFRERGSPALHVIDRVNSAAEGAKTIEKINSRCFTTGSTCDYLGSLWSTSVLGRLGEDISSYVPYLITSAKNNLKYFPYPFLYLSAGYEDYQTNILERQINNQYWKESTDRYYDTALALLPFSGRELDQKDSAIEWLFSTQAEEGCWDGKNIRNNAFLLYSIWPKDVSGVAIGGEGPVVPDNDCRESNYFCIPEIECDDGDVLPAFGGSCGMSVCCAVEAEQETCESKDGETCRSGYYCSEGKSIEGLPDIKSWETCCVGGTCEIKTLGEPDKPSDIEYTCETESDGFCEPGACSKGYVEDSDYSCESGKVCCVYEESPRPDKKSYLWLWLLFGLIVLLVIAIIYRDKIKEYIGNMKGDEKDDFPKGRGPPGMGPSMQPRRYPLNIRRPTPSMPTYNRSPTSPPPTRKILPRQTLPIKKTLPQKPKEKSPKELDDVLKKLKEMSR